MAEKTTVIEIKDEKDADTKVEKRSAEFTVISVGEDGTELLDENEANEKLAKGMLQQSEELMQHERGKTIVWEQMLIKIEAKKLAALGEDFIGAQRLKEEIEDMKNELNEKDKEWTQKKLKEKEYKEEVEAYAMSKLMHREELLKITAAMHKGHDFWILVKFNNQIQFEFMSRCGAGWSNGKERTKEEVEEFAKFRSSSSSSNW